MAARLHVSPATISAIENGKTGLSVQRLQAIARTLGIGVGGLLTAHAGAEPQHNGAAPEQDWRSFPDLRLDPVLGAAVEAFVETGYHGTSMRMLAERAGISVPGIYHHYRDKQELLTRMLEISVAELHWRVAAARAHTLDPLDEIACIVEALALYHTHRRQIAFIGASEMRSLNEPNRRRIAAERTRLQHILDGAIERARLHGRIAVDDPRAAGRAISTMCTSLSQWFRPEGPDTPERVARTYADFALSMLGAAVPTGVPA